MSADQINNRRAFQKDGAAKRPNVRSQGPASATAHRVPQQQRSLRNPPNAGPPPLIPGNQVESSIRKDANTSHNPPAPASSNDQISLALQHARTTTPGYYIGQDSKFGNLILPVLPEF
ncbi:SOSS complex subunit C [Trichoplax sp. H2]|nr:SOSS complex subunit C [Trichoplax sp. H2]|eukprot:RDD42250.1 SOSS complex subunit C [Trichoplax sp. H2]